MSMPIKMPLRSLMLALLFLPELLFFLKLATSAALGVAAAAILILLTVLAVAGRMRYSVITGTLVAAPILLFITVHLLISSTFLETDLSRAFSSFVPLYLMIVGGVAMGNVLLSSPDDAVIRAVALVFFLQCVAAFFGIIGVQPPAHDYTQPIFPFTEPSHLALDFLPVLMFLCVKSKGAMRIFVLGLGVAIAFLIKSLTMGVGLAIIVVVCTSGFMLPVAGIVAVAIGSALDITYFTSRLVFQNSQNLSTLVFIQGWQLLFQAFAKSHGWGIGFQQLGLHGALTDVSDIIFLLVGENFNLLDGGLTVAKFVGEFGVFGIVVTIFFLYVAAVSFIRIKKVTSRGLFLTSTQILASCVLLCYPMELFVRGLGYFTPTFLLVFASLRILSASRWPNLGRNTPSGERKPSCLPLLR